MSKAEETNAVPSETRRRRLRVALGVVSLAAVAVLTWTTFGPNPVVEVSPATTRLTVPLLANGVPDYQQALLDEQLDGLTTETNGAAPLLVAFWPHGGKTHLALESKASKIAKAIGINSPPPSSESFTPLDTPEVRESIRRHLSLRMPSSEVTEFAVEHVLFLVCDPVSRPWNASDLPFLAGWIEANAPAYEHLLDASRRPDWFFPCVDRNRVGLVPSIEAARLLREAVQYLITRCNFYLGTGQYELAAQDIVAVLKLASHAESAPYLATRQIGYAIERIAADRIRSISSDAASTPESMHVLLEGLQSLRPLRRLADPIDKAERLSTLATFVTVAVGGIDRIEDAYVAQLQSLLADADLEDNSTANENWVLLSPGIDAMARTTRIDWNVTLREMNRTLDEYVTAWRLPEMQRSDALRLLDSKNAERFREDWSLADYGRLITPTRRGRLVADAWATKHVSPRRHLAIQAEAVSLDRRLTEVALSLSVHRAEHGAFPSDIAELSEKTRAIFDLLSSECDPLRYELTDEGYRIDRGTTVLFESPTPTALSPWPWEPGGELTTD